VSRSGRWPRGRSRAGTAKVKTPAVDWTRTGKDPTVADGWGVGLPCNRNEPAARWRCLMGWTYRSCVSWLGEPRIVFPPTSDTAADRKARILARRADGGQGTVQRLVATARRRGRSPPTVGLHRPVGADPATGRSPGRIGHAAVVVGRDPTCRTFSADQSAAHAPIAVSPSSGGPGALSRCVHHSPFFLTMQVARTTVGVFRVEWLTTPGFAHSRVRLPLADVFPTHRHRIPLASSDLRHESTPIFGKKFEESSFWGTFPAASQNADHK